jgi:opacity protein-like surface antigen
VFEMRGAARAAVLALMCLLPAFAADPTFIPDWTFKGSALAGWSVVGQADWKALNGELIGKPKDGGGGWLVSDRSLQDIGVYAQFQCTGGCEWKRRPMA